MDTAHVSARHAQGFTLIELMVAVLVIAILGAIAMSMYSTSAQHARRTDAKTALMDLAGREERNYSATNTYTTSPASLGYNGAAFPLTVGSGYYTVNVIAVAPAAGAAPTYTITAAAAGSQTADTNCALFTVDQTGKQSSFNSGGAASVGCW
jgi:type IV pilus assembly protein PilE